MFALSIVQVGPFCEPVEPAESLQFERDNYRVAWTKKKEIRVIALPELIVKEGKAVRVTSSGWDAFSTSLGLILMLKGLLGGSQGFGVAGEMNPLYHCH